MAVCPVCNGFETLHLICSTCGAEMIDRGRMMDYYDDYSAYMPIDQMKLENGYRKDYELKLCPHYLTCSQCARDQIYMVEE